MNALLVVLVFQTIVGADPVIQSTALAYFPTMEVCQSQRYIIAELIKRAAEYPMSGLSKPIDIQVTTRCSEIGQ